MTVGTDLVTAPTSRWGGCAREGTWPLCMRGTAAIGCSFVTGGRLHTLKLGKVSGEEAKANQVG